jgi:hypothetical protein
MRRAKFKVITILLVALLVAVSVPAAQQDGKPLTNQDIVSMVKNLLPESVIVAAIKANDTNFDVSASGLIALKKAGVSSKVMEAMLAATNSKRNSASAPTPTSSDASGVVSNPASGVTSSVATTASISPANGVPAAQPTVAFVQHGSKVSLAAEATQIVETKSKADSLSTLAADQAMNESLRMGAQAAQQAVLNKGSIMGSSAVTSGTNILTGILGHRKPAQPKVTYVWALQGSSSAASAATNPPSFEVSYAGIPGVDADAFEPVIVKLAPTQSNFRLVGATEASSTAEQSAQQDWPIYSSFVEDRVAAKVQKLGSGHAKITANSALAAGQYAVALRPVSKSHKFSGEQIAKNQGEGLLFNYAWSFAVK